MALEARVGRKGAIYLPRSLLRRLGVEEGETVRIIVDEEARRVTLEFPPDPFLEAARRRPWAVTSVEEFEAESEEEQDEWQRGPGEGSA